MCKLIIGCNPLCSKKNIPLSPFARATKLTQRGNTASSSFSFGTLFLMAAYKLHLTVE